MGNVPLQIPLTIVKVAAAESYVTFVCMLAL